MRSAFEREVPPVERRVEFWFPLGSHDPEGAMPLHKGEETLSRVAKLEG